MHFSKKYLFLFILFFSILSHFLFSVLVRFTEKTSYIWHLIGQREIAPKVYDIAIMGDSQLMSGIHTDILERLLTEKKKPKNILYYPRPSEQPEGIYNTLIDFKNSNIKFKKLIVNISPVTTSKNIIVDSHKSLVQNFQPFSKNLLFDSDLNKFYFKNLSGNVYYLFLQLFPLLKLNGNFSNEVKLIPGSEGIIHRNEIKSFLEVKPLGNLFLNEKKNLWIQKNLQKENFYFEWGNYVEFSGICQERREPLELPAGIEAAFLTHRKESLRAWLKLGEFAKRNEFQIYFLYAPFSPEAEEKIGSQLISSPIYLSLMEISKTFGENSLIRIDPSIFKTEDFIDYTHLNVCGMMKLTKELADRL